MASSQHFKSSQIHLWLIPSLNPNESQVCRENNCSTTPWGRDLTAFPATLRDFKSLCVGTRTDIRSETPYLHHFTADGRCLLAQYRLNDSSTSICGSAWHLDLMRELKLRNYKTHQWLQSVWKCQPFDLRCKTRAQGQALHMRAFPNQVQHSAAKENRLSGKILVTSTRRIVPKHHLILSMSSGDVNWIPVAEAVTNLLPLRNALKRSRLSDYSNLWDSGLSVRSLAVNGRCSSGSEWLERYRLCCAQVAGFATGLCRLYEQAEEWACICFHVFLKARSLVNVWKRLCWWSLMDILDGRKCE